MYEILRVSVEFGVFWGLAFVLNVKSFFDEAYVLILQNNLWILIK